MSSNERWGMDSEFEDERPGWVRYSEYLNKDDETRGLTTWARQPLEVAINSTVLGEKPQWWTREDGAKLVYENRAHSFVGEAESLKSWAALVTAIEFARGGHGVVYVDCESTLDNFARRLKDLDGADVIEHLAYVRPDEPLFEKTWDKTKSTWGFVETEAAKDFLAVGRAYQAELLIIDGVTEVMALHGLDINQATDIARYHSMLLRRWSGKITTIEIDHVAKGDFSGGGSSVSRGAIGSQHKRAGIDGAAYLFTPVAKGGVGGISSSRVQLIKDREGMVRKDAFNKEGDVGLFVIDGRGGSGGVASRLEVRANTEAGEDLAMMLLEAIGECPRGNKTLASDLGLPEGRVRTATVLLETGGLICRDEKQRWEVVGEDG